MKPNAPLFTSDCKLETDPNKSWLKNDVVVDTKTGLDSSPFNWVIIPSLNSA